MKKPTSYNEKLRNAELAMTDKDWKAYVEKHGHTPNWPPHDGPRRVPNKKEE